MRSPSVSYLTRLLSISVKRSALSLGSFDEVVLMSEWPKKMLLPVFTVSAAAGTRGDQDAIDPPRHLGAELLNAHGIVGQAHRLPRRKGNRSGCPTIASDHAPRESRISRLRLLRAPLPSRHDR